MAVDQEYQTLSKVTFSVGLVICVQTANRVQIRGLVQVRAAGHAAEPDAARRHVTAARRVPPAPPAGTRARPRADQTGA